MWHHWTARAVTALASTLALALTALPSLAMVRAASAEPVAIKVLSNRADLVSGGDALVEVTLPAGSDPASLRVDVDGRDVTDAFAVRPNGRLMALVSALG